MKTLQYIALIGSLFYFASCKEEKEKIEDIIDGKMFTEIDGKAMIIPLLQ